MHHPVTALAFWGFWLAVLLLATGAWRDLLAALA